MKTYKSWDNFTLKGSGKLFMVEFGKTVPAPGEKVSIDGTTHVVKKIEQIKCMCGQCRSGSILVEVKTGKKQ